MAKPPLYDVFERRNPHTCPLPRKRSWQAPFRRYRSFPDNCKGRCHLAHPKTRECEQTSSQPGHRLHLCFTAPQSGCASRSPLTSHTTWQQPGHHMFCKSLLQFQMLHHHIASSAFPPSPWSALGPPRHPPPRPPPISILSGQHYSNLLMEFALQSTSHSIYHSSSPRLRC